MSAAPALQADERPQLSRGLRFVRHDADAGVQWVVKDPARQKYFRFGSIEAWLMQQMDGTRTLQQICDDLRTSAGITASPASLQLLVRRLKELGLVLRSAPERSALLLEQLRTQRRIRVRSDNTLLRMRFSFGDPNDLMGAMVRAAPFFWTRGFVIVSLAGFATYALILLSHLPAYAAVVAAQYNPNVTIPVLILTYAIITVVSVLHEFAHGLTCRRFGGEVREIGVMLLYFLPAFYCNITDAWTFERRRHRLWVTFAGGWCDLCVAAIAATVWVFTEPGTGVNTVAALTAATAGAVSMLFNYNPLLPLDGYYALVDWLELPNLRSRSVEYLGAVVRHRVFGLDTRVPLVTARERRIFISYGLAAITYSTLLLTAIAIFVALFLTTRLGGWGAAISFLLIVAVTRSPRAALVRFGQAVVRERFPRGARRRVIIAATALALVLVVGAQAPWTSRATAVATVEAARRTWVRAPVPGLLTAVLVEDGDRVAAGDTLAMLRDAELELRILSLTAQARQKHREAAAARARGNAAAARSVEIEELAALERLREAERRRADLVLVAPHAGVVATPMLAERIGAHLAAGDSVLELWDVSAFRARVTVPQPRSGQLAAGAPVRIRFPAHPGVTWNARIAALEPTAGATTVVASTWLPADADYPLRPGMQGRARVDIAHTTIAGALLRTTRRVVRLDLLL